MLDKNRIHEWAREIEGEVRQWRHYLHMHPETAYKEQGTAAFIRRKLDEMGIQWRAVGTGTIAEIPSDGKAPLAALRADIDALPIQEDTGLEYASCNPGVMHACGHDTHTAMLLGTACLLMKHREELPGPVRLIFQPAEETTGGALSMIDAGCLEDVSVIYCLHVSNDVKVGQFMTISGCIHAAADGFEIRVHGKSAHGASPDAGTDAIVIASHIVLAMQELISRETSPWDPVVLTIGKITGGTARNIICDSVRMEGTLRNINEKVRERIKRRMAEVAEGTAKMFRGSAELLYPEEDMSCYNDPEATRHCADVIRSLYGEESLVLMEHAGMGAEDFGFYQAKIPGVKVYVGTGCPEAVHTPGFRVNEEMLTYGTAIMAAFALIRDGSRV